MGTLNEDLTAIKTVEDTLTANKVARMCYTDTAYTNNDANGVTEYNVNHEQNIPVPTASVMKVNDTVLSKGYRSQASSVTRMLLNHFLGRLSYNVNKVNDNMSNLLATLISHRGTADGLATLGADGIVPRTQLPTEVISVAGATSPDIPTITGAPSLSTGATVRLLFTSAVTGADDSTALSISYNDTSYTVKVPKEGVISDFTATELTTGSFTYIDAYKYLELIFDGTDFIIIGNPLVLSGEDYEVYADGKVGNEGVGTVRALSTVNVPYGWMKADGSAISRTKYSKLFTKYNTEEVEISGTPTKLLDIYGVGDSSTTFNIPDYQEVALVGDGQNVIDTVLGTTGHSHDVYTVGEFKDDQVQDHKHRASFSYGQVQPGSYNGIYVSGTSDSYVKAVLEARAGDTTRTKSKGVTYMVKVL